MIASPTHCIKHARLFFGTAPAALSERIHVYVYVPIDADPEGVSYPGYVVYNICTNLLIFSW